VTVGLPTHNGERFLAAALESLLAQDHPDLEIVVSDNASTDGTPAILRAFAERDPRVRVDRSDELLTAAQNFNRVFAAARGPYFAWAADDDLWDPTYLRRCVAALEAQPDAVLACSGIRFIDPSGAPRDVDLVRYDNPDLSSPSVVERVRQLLRRGGWYQVYGVARTAALERTHLFQDTYGPDVVLTLELALLGAILKVPDALFFYRQFPDRTEQARVARQGGLGEAASIAEIRMTRLEEALTATARRSALPPPVKIRVIGEILRATYLDDTPIGGVARREVGSRLRQARRDRDLPAFLKFGTIRAVATATQLPTRLRRSIGRGRRFVGRVRRRLV
jgi:hypothetical protein